MFHDCKTEAAYAVIAATFKHGPYSIRTGQGEVIRHLYCKSHHVASALLLASMTAQNLGFPVWLCHDGTETYLFDSNGVCTWELS